MRTTVYLIINRTGRVDVRKNVPDLHRGEVAVRLTIQVSDAAFRSPPIPTVELNVPEPAVIMPEITIETEQEGGDAVS